MVVFISILLDQLVATTLDGTLTIKGTSQNVGIGEDAPIRSFIPRSKTK